MNSGKQPVIAIFASGNGSNFDALIAAKLPMRVGCLICDQADAPVIQRAQGHHIPVQLVNPRDYATKAEMEKAILAGLSARHVTAILLAGYMRIIGPTLLAAFPRRIVNIHPALLPSFPGRHGIEDAYRAGVTKTGVTIHFIDAGVDTGPVIAQQAVAVLPTDTVEQLANRIHSVEHTLYPQTIRQLIEEGVL
ncbi:phosphoribosylglycinamide formyltransferase [uncultured Secundilactobacillus sp.]|uniref:phosphoribosylglycinamide formyltransferase n=1 Tax=uncultured Secundilactobacillus sp. TaxID=2813935 RepID=UPI0025825675|nr:phosphoribosylglycinamide formyltransferase [uncultured Secundilactobacillus sp.]